MTKGNTPKWSLKGSRLDNGHPTITEVGTGTVACGDSWCDGACGLPALAFGELRAFGPMVALGSVFQQFRKPWKGAIVQATIPDGTDIEKMLWI